jgi:hypothetical protein
MQNRHFEFIRKRLFISDARAELRTLSSLQVSSVAGFHYHRAIGVWSFLREGEELKLVREPQNPFDPAAVAIYFRNDKLGYVPRGENDRLAGMLDRGERLSARIRRLRNSEVSRRRIQFEVLS